MNINRLLNAEEAYDNGDFVEALFEYEKEITVAPDNILAYEGAARCLSNLNRFTDSIAMCQKILELNPKNLSSHITLAVVYRAMNQLDKSRLEIQLAYAMAPESVDVLTIYGRLLLDDDKLEDARLILEEAIQRDPDAYNAYPVLLFIYSKKKDRSKMYSVTKKMYQLRPIPKNLARLTLVFMDYTRLSNILIPCLIFLIVISFAIQNWATFMVSVTGLLLLRALVKYIAII